MGFGFISALKHIAPIGLYVGALGLCLMAIAGRCQLPLIFVVGMAPLRNVLDKLVQFPLGKDMIDVMIFSILIGWALSNLVNHRKPFEKSSLIVMAFVLIVYTYCSLVRGFIYLGSFTLFNASDPRMQDWKNYCLLPIIFILTLHVIRDKKWVWK